MNESRLENNNNVEKKKCKVEDVKKRFVQGRNKDRVKTEAKSG